VAELTILQQEKYKFFEAMRSLELPVTIRSPRYDELPDNERTRQKLIEREGANIVEGFTLRQNPSSDHPFKIYAEINIDNVNLWALFKALTLEFPEEVCLVYRHIDDEPSFSRYMGKSELMDQIQPFEFELTRDGFLEFGIIYQDEKSLQEIYIKKAKYIQYWGMNEAAFRKTLADFEIYEVEDLNFIDEYPLATESLGSHFPEAIETNHILEQLKNRCS
jgi:hypothetical protein